MLILGESVINLNMFQYFYVKIYNGCLLFYLQSYILSKYPQYEATVERFLLIIKENFSLDSVVLHPISFNCV